MPTSEISFCKLPFVAFIIKHSCTVPVEEGLHPADKVRAPDPLLVDYLRKSSFPQDGKVYPEGSALFLSPRLSMSDLLANGSREHFPWLTCMSATILVIRKHL